ncbi:MAG: hypothetical protein IPI49_12450 [Myxococcales bacterium]|nr:hypothetical protein [Myxococcales bacterium]
MLLRAFEGHQRSGDHIQASRATDALSRIHEHDFEKRMYWAKQAAEEARKSGNAAGIGRAQRSLAETYDIVGMADAADKAFLEAEERLAGSRADLAHTYLKRGSFLWTTARREI